MRGRGLVGLLCGRKPVTGLSNQRGESQGLTLVPWLSSSSNAPARLALVGLALVLALWTWGHWGDFQVDCGRELYVPLEILRGRLIYRDFWYDFGPLEPYFAALLIKVFGRHLFVLYSFGLLSAISSALLLLEIGTILEGRAVGFAAGCALLMQGFAPTVFNYPFPWSYAGVLAMPLSLVSAWLALRQVRAPNLRSLGLASMFGALALLCKQEFGVACYAMLGFIVVAESVAEGSHLGFAKRACASLLGLAPALAVYAWFFWTLTPRFMLQDNWIGLPGTYFAHVGGPELYAGIGLRWNRAEVIFLIISAVGSAMAWLWIARGAMWLRRTLGAFGVLMLSLALAIAAGAARIYSAPGHPYPMLLVLLLAFPPGMLFIGCGVFAYSVARMFKTWQPSVLLDASFALFATVTGSRVFAQVLPYGYSIFYDGPLVLMFLMIIARSIDATFASLGKSDGRAAARAALAMELLVMMVVLFPGKDGRTTSLETSWGTFHLKAPEATVAREILEFVQTQKKSGKQVTVLPEFPMVYALARTEAPSRWYTILPGYLSPKAESEYIRDLKSRRPDYIIVTNLYTGRLGYAYFGIDYAKETWRWIQNNYREVGQFGRFQRGRGRKLSALLYERQRVTGGESGVRAVRQAVGMSG